MGKPIENTYGQSDGVLKFFDYKGAACVVPQSMAASADENGKKIVKAGTPFPSNDGNCLGLIFEDVDVTQGDNHGTYIYKGVVDLEKLTANGITVSDEAKKAMPNVQFYGETYSA